MNILAINFNHDGSAVLLSSGEITGYVNTERFSRKKKHPGVREIDIANLLNQGGITIDEVDHVILLNLLWELPPDITSRFETDVRASWPDFWLNRDFSRIRLLDREIDCTLEKRHAIFHAATAYYFSPFDSAIIYVCDPTGHGAFLGDRNCLKSADFDVGFNAGRVYDMVSWKEFQSGVFGAGKLMGLSPYGVKTLPPADYSKLLSLPPHKAFQVLQNLSESNVEYVVDGDHRWNATLAAHTQKLLEAGLSSVLDKAYVWGQANGAAANLCLSGGTALNSVANQICFADSKFKEIYMHPACGDDGTAIGAALYYWHHHFKHPKIQRSNANAMYSIRNYDSDIDTAISRLCPQFAVTKEEGYIADAAERIASGEVVGWFQGCSEIGPRALGNRSLLADPRREEMVLRLNKSVKKRENFRPFAPSVLNEYSSEWFGFKDSPFMLRVAPVLKSGVPAITHVDGTARFQTVSRDDNPKYHALISKFRELTGIPMVLNTSFNTKSDPVVETPEDAIRCFLESDIDSLVFPGRVLAKRACKRAAA